MAIVVEPSAEFITICTLAVFVLVGVCICCCKFCCADKYGGNERNNDQSMQDVAAESKNSGTLRSYK